MGHPGQPGHPEVLDLMGQAAERCRAIGKPVGTVGGTPELVVRYRAMGYGFVAIASDLGLLMRGATSAVQALRTQDNAVSPHVHTLSTGTRTEGGY
jgi:2-dehydro-3-deoxyglucarate aldolase